MPADLSNQIAAGEVVERPASAVKELVENAIDAGARRIRIDLEDGGLKLIRVSDDGSGMGRIDAALCIERHASSKLTHRSQLFAIGTLGFRGEALPSIASVSRFSLLTKPHGAIGGTRVVIEGGQAPLVSDASSPPGTEVTVRDLFYNTPARLKFLKSQTTELRHVVEVIERLALPHPHVGFALTHNGRMLLEHPPVTDHLDRIVSVLGRDEAKGLYTLDPAEQDGVQASGFYGQPAISRRTNNGMWVFVNGRYVRDRAIQSAIRVAYEGLIDRSRYPVGVVFLKVPVRAVDVNVHPMKIEVRFHDAQAVFRATRRAFVQSLASSPWRPQAADAPLLTAPTGPIPRGLVGPAAVQMALPEAGQQVYRAPASGPVGPISERLPSRSYVLQDSPGDARDNAPATGASSPGTAQDSGAAASARSAASVLSSAIAPAAALPIGSTPRAGYFESLHYIGTFNATYLLASDGPHLVVVDQHAAHERITYEALRSSWSQRRAERQPLLIPRVVSFDSLRAAVLAEHLEFFDALGYSIEPFGGQDFALKAVPALLVQGSHDALLRDALDELADSGHSRRVDQAVDNVLIRMACHGSVRAGQTLSPEQVLALFRDLDRIDFGANCPHGRPVWFQMGLPEIEKRFDRR